MNHTTDLSGYHDIRKAPFIWVHTQAFDYLKGNLSAFGVYCWIIKRAGHGNDGKCWESIKNIAEHLGISEGTVKRSIAYLLKSKMLRRLSRPGNTSIYQVTDPEEWTYSAQVKDDSGEGGSKTTQVKDDPGEGGSKTTQVGGSKTTQVGGSKTTHKLDPEELDPKESDPFFLKPEKSENGFKNFEKPAPAIPSIPDPPKPGLSPPRGKGSAPVLYQAPNNSAYQSVDVNKWIQAWNQADRPGKWPAMSIGMMSSQRSLECLRQFISHENGDEDAAIATMVKRLSNAKKDPYWKDRAVSAFFLTDPNKLFLTQFDAVAAEEEDFATRMYRLYGNPGDDQNAKP